MLFIEINVQDDFELSSVTNTYVLNVSKRCISVM